MAFDEPVTFSSDNILKYCSYFPRKQDLPFLANCLPSPTETICMKCQILFILENKEKYHQFAICWIWLERANCCTE